MAEHEIFDPFKVLMEAAAAPAPVIEDMPPRRVYLCDRFNKNDRRDITDTYGGLYIDKSDGVTILYTHRIVNGEKVRDRHSVHHINGYIEII